jgi:predicted lysophospholipase L1 biosynthesis ABC-type transport system permease subunit
VEPGRGRRAVPIRSALVGAVVGVVGVVGCVTFRAGLSDAVRDPRRSGIVWDQYVAGEGRVAPEDQAKLVADPDVRSVVEARWVRAVRVDGHSVPMFGTLPRKGSMPFVVLSGRAPRADAEIALAPHTMEALHAHVGEVVHVGPGRRAMRVVGRVLVPTTSHTDYDESAWVVDRALRKVVPADDLADGESVEDWVLVRFRPGVDVHAAEGRVAKAVSSGDYFVGPAQLPPSVSSLGGLRSLPLVVTVFFALLAIATVSHAIVTTVRRRRHDIAVLRAIGFTRRDVRISIAWQATLIGVIGLVLGVPLGVVVGRAAWRQLALDFPVAYAPPLALVTVVLVVPLAVVVVNLIAAWPAHAATRVRPATVLRTE